MWAEDGENLDEAIELIKKALEIEPDNGAYIDSLGWAFYKKGMVDEALVQIEKAANLLKDDPVVRDHLGDIYSKKGLIEKALKEWERSLEIDPKQEKVREKIKSEKGDIHKNE